jgi:hypothetical protein
VIPGLTTMEVAWLVSGLLHADHPGLRSAREFALRELELRLDRSTMVFRHASAAAPWRHRLRGRIANFADQVYPLQAFAFAAIVLGDAAYRALADRCGARLVAAQGPLGQWWWHHDAATGRVAGRYPVYSVHQHSTAPMALRCLAVAGGRSHAAAAARGRRLAARQRAGDRPGRARDRHRLAQRRARRGPDPPPAPPRADAARPPGGRGGDLAAPQAQPRDPPLRVGLAALRDGGRGRVPATPRPHRLRSRSMPRPPRRRRAKPSASSTARSTR